ncbi:MAG TPA: bifunctional 5,10-methylenetetrahydrofolate dehydrogenase/5,10-methenyltetrahydrofolate cyclohydrolase [Candidatus Paceibacterota bacterium]|nr:bifunctional 5,10-methylenetetrahydrofolate dehydrogenase/5,10-methenyltetrahydrofolate cyclohydrolase [Candidatus Paceibacterota bacterium]
MIIDGKTIADSIIERLRARPLPGKFFGAVLVGDDPASLNFLKQKEKVARELGIEFRLYQLPLTITTDALRAEIGRLAAPKTCGGFIVQLPLPETINRYYVLNTIPKEKDVDCLSEAALGAFYTERGKIAPPSVATVEEILRNEHRDLLNKPSALRELKAVVIGAGFLIGKPVGFWLQNRVAELVVLDASVKNIHDKLDDADIIVSGAGHAGLFSAEHLKPGAIVIDFGFNRSADGKVVGDFDPAGAEEKNIRYTKTPGGTGPILVAKLFENFYTLNP